VQILQATNGISAQKMAIQTGGKIKYLSMPKPSQKKDRSRVRLQDFKMAKDSLTNRPSRARSYSWGCRKSGSLMGSTEVVSQILLAVVSSYGNFYFNPFGTLEGQPGPPRASVTPYHLRLWT